MGACISHHLDHHQLRRRPSSHGLLKKQFRKTLRRILKMDPDMGENVKFLTHRVGHVSVQYEDQLIIVWGGYNRSKDEPESYYDPQELVIFNTNTGLIQILQTYGQIPPKTCGAAAVVHDKFMYVIAGFVTIGTTVENTNAIYRLDLISKQWTHLKPVITDEKAGLLKVDKLSAWLFENQIFISGGYGPVPEPSDTNFPWWAQHVLDPEYFRGWTNQLLIYNIPKNSLTWAANQGDIPGPRAAHATACDPSRKCVYLFGGRFGAERLNDLYIGDLSDPNVVTWTQVEKSNSWPKGRSWHTLNLVRSDAIMLYGGYNISRHPLNDCWIFEPQSLSWRRLSHQSKKHRLWHTSHYINGLDCVILIGGVQNDILTNPESGDMHPRVLDRLQMSPVSLSQTALKSVIQNVPRHRKYLQYLPGNIQMQIAYYQPDLLL